MGNSLALDIRVMGWVTPFDFIISHSPNNPDLRLDTLDQKSTQSWTPSRMIAFISATEQYSPFFLIELHFV